MGRAMSIDVAILLYSPSFLRVSDGSLDSELASATRVMRERRRTERLPSGLPFYLRSACRAQDTPPFGRTLSFPESAARLARGADSCPKASLGPLPQILFSRRGSGSRRHTRWASMYRRQRTNQKKRSQTPCSTSAETSAMVIESSIVMRRSTIFSNASLKIG
jgi:hypothetical protein